MHPLELWVPLLSLINTTGAIQEDLIATHLQWLKGFAIDGLLVMGTTGEFASLSVAQRNAYLSAIVRHNPGFPLMVNIGASSLADITALQAFAVRQPDVTQTLLMPPFYFPESDINGLDALLTCVIENQMDKMPLYLYHYPKMGQIDISFDLLRRFPNVAGVKDSSGDFERIAKLTQAFPNLKIYAGTDGHIDASRNAHATGIISALANIFPELSTAAILGSTQAQTALQQLRNALPRHAKIPALKAYLNHLHLSEETTQCVLPYSDLPQFDVDLLLNQLNSLMPERVTHVS